MKVSLVHIKHFFLLHKTQLFIIGLSSLFGIGCIVAGFFLYTFHTNSVGLQKKNTLQQKQLQSVIKQLNDLKNRDQYKRNNALQEEIKNIQAAYTGSITAYEHILDLQVENQDTSDLTTLYAKAVKYLSDINYSSASATLVTLQSQIKTAQDKFAASQIPVSSTVAPATTSNIPPGTGFSVQNVQTSSGTFTVELVAADLNSTRVIVDTASDGDCGNNCPVLPLDAYVSRSGAFAGINGTFFCPVDYPSCAGKTGSFDTLLMNKNKVYFNSSNNVYSTVPLVYFTGNTMGVRGASSDWGRDTGVDSVIAMQPLLISNNTIVFSGSDDPKFGSKGTRGFIGNIGSTVYIGDVLNATMSDGANVLHALGLNNALNLDEGGSTALWDGGYKLGPGRNIPNAVLFVRK